MATVGIGTSDAGELPIVTVIATGIRAPALLELRWDEVSFRRAGRCRCECRFEYRFESGIRGCEYRHKREREGEKSRQIHLGKSLGFGRFGEMRKSRLTIKKRRRGTLLYTIHRELTS